MGLIGEYRTSKSANAKARSLRKQGYRATVVRQRLTHGSLWSVFRDGSKKK